MRGWSYLPFDAGHVSNDPWRGGIGSIKPYSDRFAQLLCNMAFRFTAKCIGSDPLNIREQLERFANEQWLPEHATLEEATQIALDQFQANGVASVGGD